MTHNWNKPTYQYNLPSRKIVVNVTRSCPNFTVPAPAIADIASDLQNDKMMRVLDFGAGKLRNTLYLLQLEFTVWAVEYSDCFQTPAGKLALEKAKTYKGFFYSEYPNQFLESIFEVDAVLLINVANIVPDPVDRRKIIAECTKHLRSGGWLIWMSQYGEPHYKPGVTKRLRAPLGGWFYNLDRHFQTYNCDFSIPEIRRYFSKRRYREPRKFNATHHRALIFQKK